MDKNGVLGAIYNPATRVLDVTVIGGTSTAASTAQQSDENGAWQGCYDKATNTIRVVFV